ncbi:MAG: hypothetical protein GY757_05895 [bacterium]|nr:hypothetical protein [bacterium]
MNRTKISVLICLAVTLFLLQAQTAAADGKKIIPLTEIFKPVSIASCGENIYIVHEASVTVISTKDYKVIKTFGKQGEGPREFKLNSSGVGMYMSLEDRRILVNSVGKVSFFTKGGAFISEQKVGPRIRFLARFGKGYIGRTGDFQNDAVYLCFNIYDEKFEKLKEICRRPLPTFKYKDGGRFRDFFSKTLPEFYIAGERVFISGEKADTIDVFDLEGKTAITITVKEKKPRKLTGSDKQAINDVYKTHPWYRNRWELVKEALQFPDYFSALRKFSVADKKIYVQTFNRTAAGTDVLIYDLKGSFIEKVTLPLGESDIATFFLYTIKDGKLYRLYENPDTDTYELHIYSFKTGPKP